MPPTAHSSTINNSQDTEATLMCADRWMDKGVVYVRWDITLP